MQARKRKILGILLIALPPATLIVVLVLWAIVSMVFSQMIGTGSFDGSQNTAFIAQILNFVLGLLGLLSLLFSPIGFVVGIILLLKKDADQISEERGDSGDEVKEKVETDATEFDKQ